MKTVRMLVIDNSIFFRKELADAMCKNLPTGSLVESAADAIEAMEKISLFAPSVIVANVSLSATVLEGKYLFTAMSAKCRAPIISYGILAEAKEAALRVGAGDYIVKPSDSGEMPAFFRHIVAAAERLLNARPGSGVDSTAKKLQPGTIMTRAGWQAAHRNTAAKPLSAPTHLSHTHNLGGSTALTALHHNTLPSPVKHEIKPVTPTPLSTPPRHTEPATSPTAPTTPHGKINLIAVGSSTGGTEALSEVFKNLRPPLPGIVVTQHIPALFATLFAERLNNECVLTVKEGEDGETIQRDTIYIAPGNKHMTIGRGSSGYVIKIGMGPKVHSCRPSVDVLFNSVAEIAGANALGVILTGMGQDGAEGLLKMRRQGSPTLGQDEATCVVYGMPRAAWDMGAVEKQLPLNMIASAIMQIARA